MNAVVEIKAPELPAPVLRRGISEAQWRTMCNSLYPGAASESVIMVFDYCVARKLDPMKKPCHIVPMKVKDAKTGDYFWRDVVMPGIYEYRTTANRTGLYLGHSIPAYGVEIDHLGVKAPEYCDFTVYKWNPEAKMRAEFPVRTRFVEVCATFYDKKVGQTYVNDRWSRAPHQMLTKCAEAAALREAFPDELGGEHTADEMRDQDQGATLPLAISHKDDSGRPDTSGVDFELRDKWFSQIVDTLNQDKDEVDISRDLNTLADELNKWPEVYTTVLDKLAAEKIISKSKWREYLAIVKNARIAE